MWSRVPEMTNLGDWVKIDFHYRKMALPFLAHSTQWCLDSQHDDTQNNGPNHNNKNMTLSIRTLYASSC
jgi:hypothetical protein